MAELENVYKYNFVLGINDLLGISTFALNSFQGPMDPQQSVLIDDDGILTRDDNGTGTATFNGHEVTYIGSGTAQFGIKLPLLGNLLGNLLGSPVPVVAFEAGGETYLQYPEGLPPSALDALVSGSSLLVTFDISADPYVLPCFVEGTMILTDKGERPIEEIEAGDTVLTHFGRPERVQWVGKRTIPLGSAVLPNRNRLLPLRFPKDCFGPGVPHTDLFVSRQHRILLEGAHVEMNTGFDKAFAPAHHFAGELAHVVRNARSVSYYHILCDRHVVLRANGVPAESMLLGPELQDGLRDSATWNELVEIFPELEDVTPMTETPIAYPVLRHYETRSII